MAFSPDDLRLVRQNKVSSTWFRALVYGHGSYYSNTIRVVPDDHTERVDAFQKKTCSLVLRDQGDWRSLVLILNFKKTQGWSGVSQQFYRLLYYEVNWNSELIWASQERKEWSTTSRAHEEWWARLIKYETAQSCIWSAHTTKLWNYGPRNVRIQDKLWVLETHIVVLIMNY